MPPLGGACSSDMIAVVAHERVVVWSRGPCPCKDLVRGEAASNSFFSWWEVV
jgi:hypothetical protein